MEKMRMRILPLTVAAALLLTAACSDAPKEAAKKEAEKPDPPITGRQAFQKMFPSARGWATDAQPLQLQSYNLTGVKSEGGKAGAWVGNFVSVGQRKARQYTWSAMEAEGNLHKGVFAGLEQSWAGPTGQDLPFEVAAIRTDSDAALETAMLQKESKAFAEKNPTMPLMFILERTRRFPDLTWRVLWGESVGTSEYSVFVDASTGKYLERVR